MVPFSKTLKEQLRTLQYPDRTLCFWIGFLPTGIFLTSLEILVCYGMPNPVELAITFLLYGGCGGLCSFLIGFLLRNIKPVSERRWIWLSFLLPLFAFAAAGTLVEIDQSGWRGIGPHEADDWLIAICTYIVASLISSVIAVCAIAMWKQLGRTTSPPAAL
jgi:hypothetical protein